jgi:MFS transporter, AAHS family, 4-hydroxybenzoate transporter
MDDNLKVVDLGDALEKAPIGRLRVLSILVCAIISLVDGFDAQSIGMLAPDIANDLGISTSSFGPIFSAGFFGMFLGAVILAPMADRYGRKPMLRLSTLIFGAFAIATSYSTGYYSLLLLRFLTGVGLGGALPNILAYVSEYLPKKYVRTVIPILMATVPLGAMAGGALTSFLVPLYGWQSIFLIGGIIPVIMAVFFVSLIPESVRYLARHSGMRAELESTMRRITGRAAPKGGYVGDTEPLKKGSPKQLFDPQLAKRTFLLWTACFFNVLIIFFIISWIPSLLRATDLTRSAGVMAITAFSFGGLIGSLAQGALMNRFGVRGFLILEFAGSVCSFALLAASPTNLLVTVGIFVVLGFMVNGIQAGLNITAIEIYPSTIRATGIGWAGAVGRIGSMVGPLVGGLLLAFSFSVNQVYLLCLLPVAIAAFATFHIKTRQ